jgi:23S rRNA pseudoU1915 N3-methylase RlmH
MKVALHLISDSDKHFGSACDEYTKRLGNTVTVHTHKPVKHGSTTQIVEQETQLLLSKIDPKKPCIILNPQGQERTTKQRHKRLYGKNIQIVI